MWWAEWFKQALRSISTIHPLRILCLHINLPEFSLSLEYEDAESDKECPEKERDGDRPPGGANEDDRRIHSDDELADFSWADAEIADLESVCRSEP